MKRNVVGLQHLKPRAYIPYFDGELMPFVLRVVPNNYHFYYIYATEKLQNGANKYGLIEVVSFSFCIPQNYRNTIL